MKKLEKKLDCLIQEYANKKRSIISNQTGCVGHHHYSRRIKLLRWDISNIIPLTLEEHQKVHQGVLKYKLPEETLEYLRDNANMDFKDYLLLREITEDDWLEEKYRQLKYILTK